MPILVIQVLSSSFIKKFAQANDLNLTVYDKKKKLVLTNAKEKSHPDFVFMFIQLSLFYSLANKQMGWLGFILELIRQELIQT